MVKAGKSDDPSRDFDLMEQVRRGNDDAFREIVQRHQQGLLNFFRKLGILNDPEDLVQDTFIRLYKYRDRYEPKAKFTTFLYMMARQVRMDYLRKVQRRKVLKDAMKAKTEHNAEMAASDGRARRPDAQALLRCLDDETRGIVVLSIYKGLKYAEISEITGLPVGTIKSRVFTAMRKMRSFLKDAG